MEREDDAKPAVAAVVALGDARDVGDALSDPLTSPDVSITYDSVNVSSGTLATSGTKPWNSAGLWKLTTPPNPARYLNKQNIMVAIELDDRGDAASGNIRLVEVNLYYTLGMLNDQRRRTT